MHKSPLHRLFLRQQPKVKHSDRKADLLKVHANNDLAPFVLLIKKWMADDERKDASQTTNSKKSP